MPTSLEHGRRKATFLAVLSGLVALGTAAFAYTVIARYRAELAEARAPAERVPVVVAVQDIDAGAPVPAEALTLAQADPALVPEGAIYGSLDEVVGTVPANRILSGEVVRRERLSGWSAAAPVDLSLAPGTRAVTVEVDRASGVGGLLRPGSWVDVMVTIRPESRALAADWVTQTILQRVQVLAVNREVLGGEAPAAKEEARQTREMYVTLEVDPEEAEKLAFASSRGRLHLSMRHVEDAELLDRADPLVANALVGLSEPPARVAARRARRVVTKPAPAATQKAEVVEGSRVIVEQFDASGNKVSTGRSPARR